MRKSPTRSSPSWRPAGCPGFSPGARRRQGAARHAEERRHRRGYSGINVLILWGAVIEHGFPARAGSRSARRSGSAAMSARASAAPPSSMPTASFPTTNDGAPPRPARSRRPSRSSSASPSSIPANATTCPKICVAGRRRPPGLIEPEVEALIKAPAPTSASAATRAFYAPADDYVQVPPPEAYFEPINWHRTALHELGHWTGASLAPRTAISPAAFGSKNYAREELVAEMTCGLLLRLARHRADRPPCRLHRLMARSAARGQPRHRARRERRPARPRIFCSRSCRRPSISLEAPSTDERWRPRDPALARSESRLCALPLSGIPVSARR